MTRPPDHDPGYENRKRKQKKQEQAETCRYCGTKEQKGQTCEKCGAPMKGEG
jgi:methionyl-tRNA synthetase